MRRLSFAVHTVVLSVCIVALAGLVQAQYRTSIQGVVTDSTGAVVPGATLTLTNPATNEKQVRTSNDVGVYNFNALPAAPFKLEVQAKGFKTKVLDNVQLIPEQSNALDVQLDLGTESTTVNVNAADLPAIDTQTASVNGVISSNQVQHLPSFGRDVLKLAQLAPGSFGDSSQGGGGGRFYNLPGVQSGASQSGGNTGIFGTENLAPIFTNGNQVENNGISIDGISTTSAVWGGSTVITPSEDSVDNFKIVSNSYDAEDGRFSGSQLKITSKSGSNDFHGSLFYTLHSPGLNAFQHPIFFESPQRDNNHFHQFGGSVGGPIWKNKIFAFFNYETVRQPFSSVPGSGWYDTPEFDALAPSGSIAATYLSFPGNRVIGTLDPNTSTCAAAGLTETVNCLTIPGKGINVGRPLNPSTFALGAQDPGWSGTANPGTGGDGSGGAVNLDPTTPDLAHYNTINPTKATSVQYNGRLDADVTSKDRIGFAIYWVPQTTDNFNGDRAYDIFHHSQTNDAFSVIWNRTFSPTLLNELRANAAGWRWDEIKDNPQSPVGLPNDGFDQCCGGIQVANFGPNVGSHLNQWTYSFKDVVTKIYGRHTIKFGGEGTRLYYLNACFGCSVPSYGFFNIWDFLNDAPRREGFLLADPHTGKPTAQRQDDRENIAGIFVQDDIKVRPNLTLNLGLRWSYFGPLYDKNNNMYAALPGAGANFLTDLTVRKTNSWNAQKNNFGPQIGFAWSPKRFNDRLVLRGGYGLSYNQEEIAISANIQGNPGLSLGEFIQMDTPTSPNPGILYGVASDPHSSTTYPANPAFISAFGANGLPATGSAGVVIFPHNLPTLRVHHYSFDMQYDLGHQYVMSLGYQGSLSRDLLFHESPVVDAATSGFPLNASINGGDFWTAKGIGNYNSLNAEVKHQFSHQFMADAQFTWAKSMDNVSAPYTEEPYPFNTNFNYGRSDYNVTDSFKIFGMWQPVLFHGSNAYLEKIAGGWSISGIFNWHSGFPWSPVYNLPGSLYCSNGCNYFQLFPAANLGGTNFSTSNDRFENPANSNFPNAVIAGNAFSYFAPPAQCNPPAVTTNCYTLAGGTALPPAPGVGRNAFDLPGYRDVDITISKAFGLPKAPVLGESARLELRLDAYNVFNNLNLNPNNINKDISSSSFGTINSKLAARVVTFGARFSF